MNHRLEPGPQSWADLQSLYAAEGIALSEAARANVKQAHDFLLKVVASGKTVYGVNTGFGQLANVRVGADQLHQLQDNILRSHAAGLGEPLPPRIVRWMLLFKICGLIRGPQWGSATDCRPLGRLLQRRTHASGSATGVFGRQR